MTASEEERRKGEGVRSGAKGARKRDRGRIQTLIRDSIIELSQDGRFRLHFQLFAGKRSANTVPGTLDNVDLSPHLGHRCLFPTRTPFSTILHPLSLPFPLKPTDGLV